MGWRRVLLIVLVVVMPMVAIAPMWLLPTPGDSPASASDAASLEAWARQLRTGEQLPAAERATRDGRETTVDGTVYRVLGTTASCTGIVVDPLGSKARRLPGAACRP